MARPLRIEYPSAWYHVMNRGADRKEIFHNQNHFQLFFDFLEQAHERFGIEIHAYCLMNNHYHLLIRTPLPNLSKAMRYINGSYAQKYNKLHNKDGPLFRGRFKAILVEAENYLLQLTRYIHLNPVAAKLVRNPEKYPWSSYSCYLEQQYRPNWLYCDETLSRFNVNNPIKHYIDFINEGVDEQIKNFYTEPRLFPIMGTQSFIQKMNSEILSSLPLPRLPEHSNVTKKLRPSVVEIIDVVANYFKISSLDIRKNIKRTSKNKPRNIAIYLALKFTGQDRKVISSLFEGISYISLSANGRRTAMSLQKDAYLLEDIQNIKNILSLD